MYHLPRVMDSLCALSPLPLLFASRESDDEAPCRLDEVAALRSVVSSSTTSVSATAHGGCTETPLETRTPLNSRPWARGGMARIRVRVEARNDEAPCRLNDVAALRSVDSSSTTSVSTTAQGGFRETPLETRTPLNSRPSARGGMARIRVRVEARNEDPT